MSILAVTSELPWPLDSGGHLRTFHLHNELAAHLPVNLICPISSQSLTSVHLPADRRCRIEPVPVTPRSVLSESRRIMAAQLAAEPYVMYRRHYWQAVNQRWLALRQQSKPRFLWYDHIDSFLYHTNPSMHEPGVCTVLDMHNIYSLILYRLAEESGNPVRRQALRIEAARLARMEQRACREVDIVIAVSEEEATHFTRLGARSVWVAPNGVSLGSVTQSPQYRQASTSPVILFLGAMNWQPNVSAAICLARDIFPALRARCPEAQLKLVGRDPDAAVRDLGQLPGVTVTGTVPDVRPYLEEASVMAVPLLSGGGTRLKILEAFAAGLPVVSTAVGVEGIAARDGIHLHVASIDRFAERIGDVLENAGNPLMTDNAMQLIRTHYDWSGIAAQTATMLMQFSSMDAHGA